METLFFVVGSLVGAAVAVCVYKYRELRKRLHQKCHDLGVLTQRVHVLEALLKDAETAKRNISPKGG